MFGMTAKQWREAKPDLKSNIRDYTSVNELICLYNIESLNAVSIEQGRVTTIGETYKTQSNSHSSDECIESGGNDRKLLK